MVCHACGHSNSEHKSVSSGFFYCSKCSVLEENVTFSVDQNSANDHDPSKSDDVQTDLYRSFGKVKSPKYA